MVQSLEFIYPEVSTVIGLLLWIAYDIGIDMRFEFDAEDRKEQEMCLREMTRLLALAPHLCEDSLAEQKAHDAIMRFCMYDKEKGATVGWYEDNSMWMKKFAELQNNPRGFDTVRRMPIAGDLCYPTLAKTPKPFVVLDSDGSSVKLVDLDKEGQEKDYGNYKVDYIAIVDLE